MPTIRQSLVARIARLYPLYSGCGTLANSALLTRVAGPSQELAWGRVPGGLLAPAPLDDYVGRAVFYLGDLDRKISWILTKLVRPGDLVLDIGANIGLTTLILSSLVGPEGAVHAFEPIPRLQALIDLAIEKNRLSNVMLHRIAIGSENAELELHVPDGHAGQASFVRKRHLTDGKSIRVPVRKLSSLLPELRLGRIRLVKVDVEGFEPEVLRGGEDYFRTTPPEIILFELNDAAGPMKEHPSVSMLAELGYGFFGIPRTFTKMKVRPSNIEKPAVGHDVVAALRGEVYDRVGQTLSAPW